MHDDNAFPMKNGKPLIEEGMQVRILSLNQEGTVVRKPDKDNNVMVQAGILKVNIHISNLAPVKDSQDPRSNSKGGGFFKTNASLKAMDISTELDLRGFTIDDATAAIDKYIDDAVLANLKQVTIIHGKGTGALRSGVHAFLKKNRRVKSYRLGGLGEGDTGVTIVELK